MGLGKWLKQQTTAMMFALARVEESSLSQKGDVV